MNVSTLVKERIQRHIDSSPTSMVEAFEKLARRVATGFVEPQVHLIR
jgi:hypothetical protein